MTFFESISSPLMGVYFLCAVFGGTLTLLQLILMMFGFGNAEESDFGDAVNHASPVELSKMLSLRTMVAGIAFFGLGGLAALTGGVSQPLSVLIAITSGAAAIYAVYYLYWSATKLNADGSLSGQSLIGSSGSVYVRIPAGKSGSGKVLICQQGRTVEYEAVTAGDELKTNTPIIVVQTVSTTTLEVAPA